MDTSTLTLTQDQVDWLSSLPPSDCLSALAKMAGKTPPRVLSTAERERERVLRTRNAASKSARDVGTIPDIANPGERENARWDLLYHLERYHEEKWDLGWCKSHRDLIAVLQDSLLSRSANDLICVALPRGSGKTSIARCAIEWAVLHGHVRWPILLEADNDAYLKQIRSFQITFRTKAELAADFPETVWVVQQMSTSQAAPNMTHEGTPMNIIWKTNEIVLPTNRLSLERGTAAGIISGGGITGSVRGAQLTLATGEIVRPDAFVINDPQTRESASSPKQIKDRISIISADLLGMGGPGKPMRGVMTGTVITKNDLIDQVLGPEFPQWHSLRGKWLERWPDNMNLWNEYAGLLRRVKAENGDMDEVNRFYVENRHPRGPFCRNPGMDTGAAVYWDARINPPYVSSLQSFMSWWILDPESAMSEGQNEPEDPHEPEDVVYCSREEILAKVSAYEQFQVPDEATELVAFVDVQAQCLPYAVMAICPGYRRYVIDYGIWPDQRRKYWTRSSLAAKLSDIWASPKEAWTQGLARVKAELGEVEYSKANGQKLPLSLGLVDMSFGDSTDSVFRFCRDFGGGTWFPSQGVGGGSREINHGSEQKAWQKRHVDWGPQWNRRTDHDRRWDRFRHDSDFYKSSVHIGIRTPEPDEGSLQFWNDDHSLLADHLRAEYPEQWEKGGRKFTHWEQRPTRPDNDLFDCLSGCSVAASIRKINPPGTSGRVANHKRRGRKVGRAIRRARTGQAN